MSRSRWGPITWIFLHSFAERIPEPTFASNREFVLQTVMEIVSTLPCPQCSAHAVKYVKSSNFHRIETSEHLKIWLHQFHNAVNARLNKPQFSVEDRDSLYPRADMQKVYREFVSIFGMKRAENLMIDTRLRRMLLQRLNEWFAVWGDGFL
jgi:hypothetical protein